MNFELYKVWEKWNFSRTEQSRKLVSEYMNKRRFSGTLNMTETRFNDSSYRLHKFNRHSSSYTSYSEIGTYTLITRKEWDRTFNKEANNETESYRLLPRNRETWHSSKTPRIPGILGSRIIILRPRVIVPKASPFYFLRMVLFPVLK